MRKAPDSLLESGAFLGELTRPYRLGSGLGHREGTLNHVEQRLVPVRRHLPEHHASEFLLEHEVELETE